MSRFICARRPMAETVCRLKSDYMNWLLQANQGESYLPLVRLQLTDLELVSIGQHDINPVAVNARSAVTVIYVARAANV